VKMVGYFHLRFLFHVLTFQYKWRMILWAGFPSGCPTNNIKALNKGQSTDSNQGALHTGLYISPSASGLLS